MRAYGYNAASDRLLEMASSYWTISKNPTEYKIGRVYANSGPIAARLYVYGLEAIRDAKDSARSLKSAKSAGNDWPLDYGGHPNEVWLSPTNTYGAMLKTAYWLAVAARYGYPALAVEAERLQKKAYDGILTYAFGSGQDYSTNVMEIQKYYNAAAAAMDAAGARTDGRMTSIYRIFNVQADPESIHETQTLRDETSVTRIFDKAGNDITSAVFFLRGLVTGEKPPGMGDAEWFFKKWGLRLAIGGAGAIALLAVARPYVQPLLDLARKSPPTQANRRRRRRRRQKVKKA